MGPKRSKSNSQGDSKNSRRSIDSNQRSVNNSRNQRRPQEPPQPKPFFFCCGSAEDVYNNQISRPEDIMPPKDQSPKRQNKNHTINSTTSTASVASTSNSGPPPLHSQLPVGYLSRNSQETGPMLTPDTSRDRRFPSVPSTRPHPNSRLNSKELTDISELDTSVTTEKKGVQTRPVTENQSNTIQPLKSSQGRDSSKQTGPGLTSIVPVARDNTNTNPARDNATQHGVYGTLVTPVTATASPPSGFNDMNKMFDVTNIKFDRSQPTMGEQIAAIGDIHLNKLEEGCKVLLERIREEKARRYRYFTESVEYPPGSTLIPPPVSGDYTEVALIFTEVLQLQNRPKDAVQVLSKAIEMLNTDLLYAKNHRATSSSHITSNNSPNNTISSSPMGLQSGLTNPKQPIVTAAEFDQLKKMKGYCHRRLGSLYKLLSRYPEAEEHIKKYISILSRQGSSYLIRKERANAFSLLATIYELMDRTEEALAADKQALELLSITQA